MGKVWPTHKLVCQSYSLDATCFRQPDLTRAETDAYCRDPTGELPSDPWFSPRESSLTDPSIATVREQMKVHLMIKPGEDVEQVSPRPCQWLLKSSAHVLETSCPDAEESKLILCDHSKVIWTYMQELHNEPPPGVPFCAASLETRSKRRWRFRGPLNNEIADGNDLGKTATPFVELCIYARASWIGDQQETMLFDGVPDSETNEFMRQTLIYLTLRYQARRKKVDMATVELAFERIRVLSRIADDESRPSKVRVAS